MVGLLQGGKVRYSGPIKGLEKMVAIRSELVVELIDDRGEWRSVSLPGVDLRQPSAGLLVAHVSDLEKWDTTVPRIIEALMKAGCHIRSFNRHDPKLEDLYMAYVGIELSLGLLIKDEMNGFYRSKVMAILFVGLPLLAVLLYFLSPDLGSMPLGAFTAMLVSSVAGLLASTTLAVSIINERSQGAFDLFLVRPVKRSHLLLAKYLAVVACVVMAAVLALVLANGYDWYTSGAMDLGRWSTRYWSPSPWHASPAPRRCSSVLW